MTGVTLDIQDKIAVVTLDRPEAGNRVDENMAAGLAEACAAAERDDAVRVIVLTGAGDCFCVGSEPDSPATPAAFNRLRSSGSVASVSKPVIAAVNGDTIDQGLELALASDLRVASSGARFGLTHITRGLVPWDGGTQRLPRLIGLGRATELVLTGRLVDAGEAHRIGLVNETVSPGRELSSRVPGTGLNCSQPTVPAAQRFTPRRRCCRGRTSSWTRACASRPI